ncbi:MAG: hypothetical protein NT069_07335 [Planctomycetota bacterium]|nr:hypothetical protein [Planctomycetota bacterium]
MSSAVFDGFIKQQAGFILPNDFGLHSSDGNYAVRQALLEYICAANQTASAFGFSQFKQRLDAFQNGMIRSDVTASCFDDFFSYCSSDMFDESGNAIPQ